VCCERQCAASGSLAEAGCFFRFSSRFLSFGSP
jgi:hypothetical protein